MATYAKILTQNYAFYPVFPNLGNKKRYELQVPKFPSQHYTGGPNTALIQWSLNYLAQIPLGICQKTFSQISTRKNRKAMGRTVRKPGGYEQS